MKKSMLFMGLLVCIPFLFWNCDDGEGEDTLSALVMIRHYYAGRRAPDWNVIHVPSIWARAEISGDKIPDVSDVSVAGKTFKFDPGSFYQQLGYVYFSSYTRIWKDSIPEPKFDPINISINTDLGLLEGSITVPDTIETMTISITADTVPLGTPVTISWTGSNADFYDVYFFHDWMEGEGYWLGYSVDTVVTGNSVTFEGSRFNKDGMLSYFEITPLNGPFPEPGAKSNMTGDGYGFIYIENQIIESDQVIVIGNGIDFSIFLKKSGQKPDRENRSEMVYNNIRRRLEY